MPERIIVEGVRHAFPAVGSTISTVFRFTRPLPYITASVHCLWVPQTNQNIQPSDPQSARRPKTTPLPMPLTDLMCPFELSGRAFITRSCRSPCASRSHPHARPPAIPGRRASLQSDVPAAEEDTCRRGNIVNQSLASAAFWVERFSPPFLFPNSTYR